jgi:3-deoxy-manno-octulosonate cytidylyltransferase (CMP-KDO synthetase)
MILALIPARLNSARLPYKPLLKIDNIPLIIHVMKRVMMCKKIHKVIVCADDVKIKNIVEKYGGECVLTSKLHKNGTERINEVASKFKKYQLIIDVQCDEIFIKPNQLSQLIKFHLKNKIFDIVVPNKIIPQQEANNINVVKIISNKKNKILYMTRSLAPSFFRQKKIVYKKHLDFISFTSDGLKNYSKLKKSINEESEGIELNRAIDNNMSVGTFSANGNNFSINTRTDLLLSKKLIKKCSIRKKY